MKVLVSGCAGFIGSHVCERLLEMGFSVIGIDNFSKFYSREIKESNLSYLTKHANFHFIELDIRDLKDIKSKLTEKVDFVIHLAAKAGVRPSIIDPESYIDANIKGSQHLLQWMVDVGCKKMFFASSSSVYGNNKNGTALAENQLDGEPISPYAFTKRSTELMNYTYHHLYNIDFINARFFTVYGPRQRPDLAIHKFVKLIDSNKPIEMYGNGSTSRDYTYINDTVDGIINGSQYLLKNTNVFETLNLGNSKPIRLKDLIATIYKQMGIKENVLQKEMQEGDVNITFADITKAKELIGYQPKITLEKGISNFIEWYRKQKNS